MVQLVNPGYIGIAQIGSEKIRCSGFNVNPKQDIIFYDHIVGLRDSTPIDLNEGKGDIADFGSFPNNLQKTMFRTGVKIIQGTMDFPLTENIGSEIFNLAAQGEWFDIDFDYDCESSRRFIDCKINTYSFSIVAGDIATVSLGIIGIGLEDYTTASIVGNYTTAEKLVTWDKVDINVNASQSGELWDNLQSFEMTINNNIRPIYTSGSNQTTGGAVANNLNPLNLRVGMQHVTGTITKYNKKYPTLSINGPVDIIVSFPQAVNFTMRTIMKPMTVNGAIGPIISAYGYEAIDKHFY